MRFYDGVIPPHDANGAANSEDLDQTARLGAVISRSAPFSKTCLSKDLGSLQYFRCLMIMNKSVKQVLAFYKSWWSFSFSHCIWNTSPGVECLLVAVKVINAAEEIRCVFDI